MGLGISKFFVRQNVRKNIIVFYLRRKIFGFDNANLMLNRIDKNSLKEILIRNGAEIGDNSDIETGITFHNCTDYKNLIIGSNCHIGKNCFFDLRGKIIIEDNVVISMKSTFITHLDLNKSELCRYYPAKTGNLIIKKNAYVGANSTILMSVTLNEGSFIAAGSVVTKDVDAYTVVGGVPAKIIKKLFIL